MVTSLAYTHHGRLYLAQEGVIDQISNIIVGADSDPFSTFYLPGKKYRCCLGDDVFHFCVTSDRGGQRFSLEPTDSLWMMPVAPS